MIVAKERIKNNKIEVKNPKIKKIKVKSWPKLIITLTIGAGLIMGGINIIDKADKYETIYDYGQLMGKYKEISTEVQENLKDVERCHDVSAVDFYLHPYSLHCNDKECKTCNKNEELKEESDKLVFDNNNKEEIEIIEEYDTIYYNGRGKTK